MLPAVGDLLEEGDAVELLGQPLVDRGALVGLLGRRGHLGEDGAHLGGSAEAVPVAVNHDGLFFLEVADLADSPDSVVPVLLEPAFLGILDELGVVLLPGSVGDELALCLGLDDCLFEALQGGFDFFFGSVRFDSGQHVKQLGLERLPFSCVTLGSGGSHLADVRSALSGPCIRGLFNLGDNGIPHLGVSVVGVGDGLVLGARGVGTFARSKPLAGVVIIVGIEIHWTWQVVGRSRLGGRLGSGLGSGLSMLEDRLNRLGNELSRLGNELSRLGRELSKLGDKPSECLLADDGARFFGSFGLLGLGLSLSLLCLFISARSLSAASQLDSNRLLLVLLGGLGTLLGLALGATGRGLHWASVLAASGASAGRNLLGDQVAEDLDKLLSGSGGFELGAHLVVDAELAWGQDQEGLWLAAINELEVVARTRFGGSHAAAGGDKLDESGTEMRKLDLPVTASRSSLAEQVAQGVEKVGTRSSHGEWVKGACVCVVRLCDESAE